MGGNKESAEPVMAPDDTIIMVALHAERVKAPAKNYINRRRKTMNTLVELLSEEVHNSWWKERLRQGVTNHPDMIPYCDLADNIKEYDRVTVRTVLEALNKQGHNFDLN